MNTNTLIKTTVTDVITQADIQTFSPNTLVLISAGTGSGKSYFIKNSLYQHAKEYNEKILVLMYRTNAIDKLKNELLLEQKDDTIHVLSCQQLEYYTSNSLNNDILSNYKYIVCDEFNYFISEINSNYTEDLAYEQIISQKNSIKIFMTATHEDMERYINAYNTTHNICKYTIPLDHSYIKSLSFFSDEIVAKNIAEQIISKNEKAVIFFENTVEAYIFYKQFENNATFNYNKLSEYYECVDTDKIRSIINNCSFDTNLLVITTCMDTGIDFKDKNLKTIIAINIKNTGSLIQCVGRKRIIDSTDTLDNLYIKEINNQQLAGMIARRASQLKKAELIVNEDRPLLTKYNTVYRLIFSTIENHNIIFKFKPMQLLRHEDMIQLYKTLLKDEHGYRTYISNLLGFNGLYDYINSNSYRLIDFLESIVDVPMLTPKDREPLIEQMNIKKNGRIVKGLKTLNGSLEDSRLPYFICQYSAYKTIDGKRKQFKNIWEVKRK